MISCLYHRLICDTFVRFILYQEMDNTSVKSNIARIRKARRITQTDMAEKLGISRNAYRGIESGETRLLNESLEEIARILDKTPEELILGYTPSEDEERIIEDLKEKYAIHDQEHREQIDRLNKTISALESRIELLEDLVRTKEEIITMLKGR